MLLILIELILRDPGRQMYNQLVGGGRVDGPDFAGSALSVKLHNIMLAESMLDEAHS